LGDDYRIITLDRSDELLREDASVCSALASFTAKANNLPMRFFDTDWLMILLWLEIWRKFSPASRRYYLEAKSHAQSMDPQGYGDELEQAVSVGLVEQVASGRAKPTKASTPFRALMVQLAKWPLFEGKPEREQLKEYLHKHYVSDENRTLYARNRPAWDSGERPASFLEAKDISAWERPLLSYYELAGNQRTFGWGVPAEKRLQKTWFPTPETGEAAQFLVSRALDSRRVWLLQELVRELPERLRPALDSALKACLRHALLFAALDPHSLDLLVGVCPFILHLANRPAPVLPVVEACADAEGVAFHVEDMTQVLALAATDECYLNVSGYGRQFFKSVETRLQEEFVPLPGWLAGRADFRTRLHSAAESLDQLRLITDTHRKETKRRLKATAEGRKWLAQAPADRLRQVLFECQRIWKNVEWAGPQDSRDSYYDYAEDYELEMDEDFGDEDEQDVTPVGSNRSVKELDLLGWQKSVWRQAPIEGCVALDAFLDYHARVSWLRPADKPGVSTDRKVALGGGSGEGDIAAEELCRARLENFFWQVMIPFGCVQATQRGDSKLWFRLSSAGQYLVGLKKTVQYGPEATAGAVVVQPNFEIVFLGPDLGAEVAMAAFAERCGRNVGTLFRLTQPKMILAASRGATAESVLTTLKKHSSTPIPENVVAEVKAWFGACRSLALRQSILIQAEDAETALRVKQLLGSECRALSATLLEWPESSLTPKLVSTLREQGLFVEKASRPAAE
jgi:hypothetical protein